jgi:hypothetical protein
MYDSALKITPREDARIRILPAWEMAACRGTCQQEIGPCIVAKCGHFRARKWQVSGYPGVKWTNPETIVWFFAELLSNMPEKGAIRSDFGLRWEQVAGSRSDWAGPGRS